MIVMFLMIYPFPMIESVNDLPDDYTPSNTVRKGLFQLFYADHHGPKPQQA